MTLSRLEQLTESLAASETIAEMALKAAGAGRWLWRFEDDMLLWDDQMHKLFDTKDNEFTGKVNFFFSALYPCDVERVGQLVMAAKTTQGEYRAEYRTYAGRHILALGKATEHYMTGICLETQHDSQLPG